MTNPTAKIILIGPGGHCRSCIDVIEQLGTFAIAGVVYPPDSTQRPAVLGYPALGTDTDLPELHNTIPCALVTVGMIGSRQPRQSLLARVAAVGFEQPSIVSPLAYVSPHAQIGPGTIVMHHAVVNAGASVGAGCIVNSKALIEHDAAVGDHCHVSTGAVVNGQATLGAGNFLGSGAMVVHGVTLGENLFFPAGKVIQRDEDGRAMK